MEYSHNLFLIPSLFIFNCSNSYLDTIFFQFVIAVLLEISCIVVDSLFVETFQ
jgi:hypothetical protein